MNIKKNSLIIIGIIWLLAGIRLSISGAYGLSELGIGAKIFIFAGLAILIGFAKGRFILTKVALKYYNNSHKLELNNIFTGWAKILGVKGFILISVMVGAGVLLRHSNIDRPILGILYLAIGIALVYASKIFFEKNSSV